MGALFDYQQQVQRLVGYDESSQDYSLDDLGVYINMARRQVAAQGECVRWLTPAGGAVESIDVQLPGSNYTNPIVVVSPPDAPTGALPFPSGNQAVATAQVSAGAITNISVSNGGDGYFQPQADIIDPTGSGAVLVPKVIASVNRTHVGQEIYNFVDIDLGPDSGVKAILSVRNITIIWANLQYTIQMMSVSKYMKTIRSYSRGYQMYPQWGCQFGQGEIGTVRLFPVPDQEYAMQWDCLVVPADLVDDQSFEAIPDPWRDAVPFYAAYMAILGMSVKKPQLAPLADKYYNPKDGGLFGDMMRRSRAFVQPSQTKRLSW